MAVVMNSFIDNHCEILLSIHGTNIWSGQQPQQCNSQAVALGSLSHELFRSAKDMNGLLWGTWLDSLSRFHPGHSQVWPKLRADYLYTTVIVYVLGCLEKLRSAARLTSFTATTSDGLVSGSSLVFHSRIHFAMVVVHALPSLVCQIQLRTSSELVSILICIRVSMPNSVMNPLTEALK